MLVKYTVSEFLSAKGSFSSIDARYKNANFIYAFGSLPVYSSDTESQAVEMGFILAAFEERQLQLYGHCWKGESWSLYFYCFLMQRYC